MRQAQQLGGKLQGISEELKQKRVTGTAGGGLVEVEANGLGEVLSCKLDPSLLQPGDKELVEDLVVGAVNRALARAKALHAEAVKQLAGGINVPGLDDTVSKILKGETLAPGELGMEAEGGDDDGDDDPTNEPPPKT
ncbi:MAG: YbaB/EbfC family nucleoid-associated protein [Planctomycetia bacterium]|nr:YbaB/EbfC family nucleoid-associated protein [Planctomycetia bacterium]